MISISITELTLRYAQGSKPITIFSDLTLEIEPAAVTAITGPSGSGKTSLLRIIAGQQSPTAGKVEFRSSLGSASSRPVVAFVYQDFRLVDFLTSAENIALAAEMAGRTMSEQEISAVLSDLGLASLATQRPDSLSGGEQQRVALGRAIATGAQVIIADEPTGSLDRVTATSVADLLLDLATARELTVVVATHDPVLYERAHKAVPLDQIGTNERR